MANGGVSEARHDEIPNPDHRRQLWPDRHDQIGATGTMVGNAIEKELAERQRRLRDDPAFFAFIAMQNSITKHDNTRSAARDRYFFGPTLFMAINDRTERERLFAMANLTESPQSPFLDARLNLILQALRNIEVRNPGTTGLSALAETLQKNGHLESVGGVSFLERKLRDPV